MVLLETKQRIGKLFDNSSLTYCLSISKIQLGQKKIIQTTIIVKAPLGAFTYSIEPTN